jgi:hypothetical protein
MLPWTSSEFAAADSRYRRERADRASRAHRAEATGGTPARGFLHLAVATLRPAPRHHRHA